MKKYRIVKYNRPGFTLYTIQKRMLFWWIGLDSVGESILSYWMSPEYYDSLDKARNAIRRFNPKKIIVDEV